MLKDINNPVSEGVTGITSAYRMFRGTKMESFTAADFFDETSANVTNMAEMFNLCNFNQNISGWDVSSVTDMRAMFKDSEFNQNISS